MLDIVTYHGHKYIQNFRGVNAYKLVPETSGHLRFHTVDTFIPPYVASWWVYPYSHHKEDRTSGAMEQDGLHVHPNHLDNDMNCLIHAVRDDGHAKLAIEYGLQEYQAPPGSFRDLGGVPLKLWRRYLFTMDVDRDMVSIKVRSDDKVGDGVNLDWQIPPYAPDFGSVGWRFDNLSVYMGNIMVRSM